ASELKTETSEPANLIDIRDDPWFWSIGRPLAIAAVLALLAIVSGVAVFSSRHERVRVAQADALRLPPVPQQPAEVEGELQIPTEAAPPPATTTASKLPLAAGAPAKAVNGFATKSSPLDYALNKTPARPLSRDETL